LRSRCVVIVQLWIVFLLHRGGCGVSVVPTVYMQTCTSERKNSVCTRDTHTTHADGSCDQVEGSNLHKKTISEIRKRCTMTTQRLGRPSNTTKHTHTHRRIHAYTLTSTRRTLRWTSSASTPGTARTNTPSTTTRPRLCRRRCAPHSERRFHARSRTWRCPTGPRGR